MRVTLRRDAVHAAAMPQPRQRARPAAPPPAIQHPLPMLPHGEASHDAPLRSCHLTPAPAGSDAAVCLLSKQKLTPEWEAAARQFAKAKTETPITLAKYDCTAEGNKALADKFGIKGFPTIKVCATSCSIMERFRCCQCACRHSACAKDEREHLPKYYAP